MDDRSNSAANAKILDDILTLFDEEFISAIYPLLLGRPSDPPGASFYLRQLRSGWEKIDIICQIVESREGQEYNAQVDGLPEACEAFRKSRNPWRRFFRRSFGLKTGGLSIERQLCILANELGATRIQLARQLENSSQRLERSVRAVSFSDSVPQEETLEQARLRSVIDGFGQVSTTTRTTALILLQA